MNILPRPKQIEVIAALCEGVGIRATARLTGVNRETVGKLALDIGNACAALHDGLMVGVRVARLELDECWSFVGKKQKRVRRHEAFAKGDQYLFVGMAGTQKAIISYRVGKRDSENTDLFIRDLRERVIGAPEISTDGFPSYALAIRHAFAGAASHGTIVKTLSVTDLRKDAAHRYSPAAVVAVSREVLSGLPEQISTSFIEREHLSLRMSSRRFTRLTNGFSKKLDNHVAAVSLYVMHYNFCRVHETLRATPAMALNMTDRPWSIGDLLDAAMRHVPPQPTVTAPDRRRQLRVIEGGKK
jgi:IS1 family transposase